MFKACTKSEKIEITAEFAVSEIQKALELNTRGYNYGITEIVNQLRNKACEAIWNERKEEIIASIDWKKLTPTLERLALEQLAMRAINPGLR